MPCIKLSTVITISRASTGLPYWIVATSQIQRSVGGAYHCMYVGSALPPLKAKRVTGVANIA